MNESLIKPYWALRIGLGASAFLAGLDKFFNILAQWDMYLGPIAGSVIPVDPALLMRVFGVVEMAVGATILFGATQVGAWVASAWLLVIAANLVTTGSFYDVAVRDVNMAIAAIALARLDALRVSVREPLAIRPSTQTT
ncbi:MAG: hypothetical protein WC538_03280 [Thermoanaerobaculia bacterium]|jgi:uncharacterized membrane protein YphA (DoxX/SURF4 family)